MVNVNLYLDTRRVKAFTDYMEEFMGTKVKAGTCESYAGTLAKLHAHSPSCTFREMDWACGSRPSTPTWRGAG